MNEAPIKTESITKFMTKALAVIVTDHAEELEHNRKLADRLGGLMTLSSRAMVAKGPLAGRTVVVSVAIDPEDED